MNKTLLLSLVLLLVSSMAFAWDGNVGVFADIAGTNCNLPGTAGSKYYYVVFVLTTGTTGVQYWAPKPACMGDELISEWLSDTYYGNVNFGDTQTGHSTSFPSCLVGPVLVSRMRFMIYEPIPACCGYPVLPHPGNENHRIEGADCDFNLTTPVAARTSMVNADQTCQCVSVVPAQDTTWGSVKALFE